MTLASFRTPRYHCHMTTVYIGLRSNHGDRAGNLRTALWLLAPEIAVLKISPVYETEPAATESQKTLLNAVVEATTDLLPTEVLKKAHAIEAEMGEHLHGELRIIDVDILFYGSEIIHSAQLKIPHPGIEERAYVLAPLADIAPDLVHPRYEKSIREMLAHSGDFSRVAWKTNVSLDAR